MPPMTPHLPPFFYLNPFAFIVDDKRLNTAMIFEFDEKPTDEQLAQAVADYWEDYYGENEDGELDSNRDGCVVFYQDGEVCVQYGELISIPKGIAQWHKDNHGVTVARLTFDKLAGIGS